jgi:outer membrane lipoprotein-sorting protein
MASVRAGAAHPVKKDRNIMFKKTAALLLVISAFFEVFPAEPEIQSLIKKKYNQNATIETQFDLHIWWSVRERKESKKGKLYLAPRDKFRLELGSETVVSDGKDCWQYSKKSGQVIIKNLQDLDLSYHPSKLLSSWLNDYSFTHKGTDGSATILFWKADSLSGNSSWDTIEVHASNKTGVVNELKLTDRNGNIHTYKFNKTSFNSKIPGEVFKFEVPGDAQVLDSRK